MTDEIRVVDSLPTDGPGDFGVFNREPLVPNALAKLPIVAVKPAGWLRGQLELAAKGMIGRLDEISPFITEESGWWNGRNPGWEDVELIPMGSARLRISAFPVVRS